MSYADAVGNVTLKLIFRSKYLEQYWFTNMARRFMDTELSFSRANRTFPVVSQLFLNLKKIRNLVLIKAWQASGDSVAPPATARK